MKLDKLKRVMKLTVFLLTVFCIHVSAGVLSQNVTLSVNNEPLHRVLKAIKKQTDYTFFARTDLLKKGNKVTLDLKNVPITEMLAACFKNQPFGYSIDGNIIIVEPKPAGPSYPASSDRQPDLPRTDRVAAIPIRGRVTDADGKSLDGASIAIGGGKGNNNNVAGITNADGVFSLNVEVGQTLIVSFVGYESKEVEITPSLIASSNREPVQEAPQYFLNISLKQASGGLDQVVVVTALNIKKNPRSLGYSVVQLDGSKVNTVQTPSLASALSGKVAGVDVGNIANGIAGTKRIVIRGAFFDRRQQSLMGDRWRSN